MDFIPGLWPGTVDTYDPVRRTCRIKIDNVTDGSSILPEAIVMPPIGDRGNAGDTKDQTELRILPGDPVWLMFEGGDPRYPIIMGARLKRAGNPTGWRRWRHANFEITADGQIVFNAASVVWNVTGNVTEHIGGARATDIAGNETKTVGGTQSEAVTGNASFQAAALAITAPITVSGSVGITGNTSVLGNFAATGGTFTHGGKPVGNTHFHTAQGAFSDTTTTKP